MVLFSFWFVCRCGYRCCWSWWRNYDASWSQCQRVWNYSCCWYGEWHHNWCLLLFFLGFCILVFLFLFWFFVFFSRSRWLRWCARAAWLWTWWISSPLTFLFLQLSLSLFIFSVLFLLFWFFLIFWSLLIFVFFLLAHDYKRSIFIKVRIKINLKIFHR